VEKEIDNDVAKDIFVRYIQFDLGSKNYAIPLSTVKEVIPFPETTPLPNAPKYFLGLMNLRGQIISVIDLRNKLNITPKIEGLEEAVIIVEFFGVGIGVVIDSINKVLSVKDGQIKEVPEVQSQINSKFISGVHQDEKSLTIMLDLPTVLNIEEVKKYQSDAA
jgi:purine-binding chemotaxis protein CheW